MVKKEIQRARKKAKGVPNYMLNIAAATYGPKKGSAKKRRLARQKMRDDYKLRGFWRQP